MSSLLTHVLAQEPGQIADQSDAQKMISSNSYNQEWTVVQQPLVCILSMFTHVPHTPQVASTVSINSGKSIDDDSALHSRHDLNADQKVLTHTVLPATMSHSLPSSVSSLDSRPTCDRPSYLAPTVWLLLCKPTSILTICFRPPIATSEVE